MEILLFFLALIFFDYLVALDWLVKPEMCVFFDGSQFKIIG